MNDSSYNDWLSMSDKALSVTIGNFIQHHRLNQNKTQEETSAAAGISRSTLSLLERGEKVTLSSLIQVLRVLDLLYVMDIFKVSNEISPIEYVKLQKNKRQRARNQHDVENIQEDTEW
jgi:transcriptional regulator with XRE-family HTH domain